MKHDLLKNTSLTAYQKVWVYKRIKSIHKKIQKESTKNNSQYDKVFIRHWNVFYNHVKNRDITVIENISITPLFPEYLQVIANHFKMELETIETSYTKKGDWSWMMQYSKTSKILTQKEGTYAK